MLKRRAIFGAAILGLAALTGCTRFTRPDASLPDGGTATDRETELPAKDGAKLCLRLAEDLEKNGHAAEAAAEYEKARQHDPKLHVARRLGMVYEHLGEQRKAQQEYERALQENPKDFAALNDLGYLHYSRGQYDDAEKRLREALAMNPKYARAWVNLGLTLGQKNKYTESLEAFEKAVGGGEAYANLAFVFLTQGKKDEARQAYHEALKREPDLRVARAALAKLDAPGDALQ